ncbi:MAG: gluconate 2-dehydrogenase subunit 3 family protein [Bdellovibrionales bacterium]|nr:gluconate 2-dehydrogenase subunit 3 family protein [Bdellovibrionales bacterium]
MADQSNLVQHFLAGKIERREFLRQMGLLSGAASLSSILGCSYALGVRAPELSPHNSKIIQSVQQQLLPSESNAPGAREINAFPYLQFVLLDPRVDDDEKELLQNGAGWIDDEAQERFSKEYLQLSPTEQQQLLAHVVELGWGERWCALLLTYLFEALLTDPLYGGNPQAVGWRWLEHQPGLPRPRPEQRYPKNYL